MLSSNILRLFLTISLIITMIFTTTPIQTNSIQISNQNQFDQIKDIKYNGYICFLIQIDSNMVDVYLRPNEDCILQAFDIYFNTSGIEVISHTNKDIRNYDTHIMSIANGLEIKMIAHHNYKIATVIFPLQNISYSIQITKADLAIAYTPFAPVMDPQYLEFDPIIIQ